MRCAIRLRKKSGTGGPVSQSRSEARGCPALAFFCKGGAVQAMASCNPLEFRRRRKRPRQSHRAPEFLRAGWEGRTPLWPSKKTHAAIATARDEMQIARCRSIDSDSRTRQESSVTAPIVKVIHHNQPFGIKSPALAKKRKSGAPAHPPTKIQLRCRMVRDGGRGAQKRSTMPVEKRKLSCETPKT